MTRPYFSRDRVSDFDIFDRHTDEMVAHMRTSFKEGAAIDFQVRGVHFYRDRL